MIKQFTFIDVFAGCGGLSKGFELAGLSGLGAVEFWHPAVLTYQANFSHPVIDGDVTKNSTIIKLIKTIGTNNEVDIVAGGFPCQGFSLSGLRRKNDHRNKLYIKLLEIVQLFRPKVLVMENVKGLLSMLDGEVIKK